MIYFLIKSLRIEPIVVERKNRFIFQNKSLLMLSHFKYCQDIGMILKNGLQN